MFSQLWHTQQASSLVTSRRFRGTSTLWPLSRATRSSSSSSGRGGGGGAPRCCVSRLYCLLCFMSEDKKRIVQKERCNRWIQDAKAEGQEKLRRFAFFVCIVCVCAPAMNGTWKQIAGTLKMEFSKFEDSAQGASHSAFKKRSCGKPARTCRRRWGAPSCRKRLAT